jgi:DNA-binding MarR family transcriptional regulator
VPLSDIPLSAQVILFLTIFVLIGIYPFIKKSMAQLRKLMDAADRPQKMFTSLVKDVHQEVFPDKLTSGPLNDFETIVLRRIAQTGGKAMSLKQINESLLFGDAVLTRTLKSLYRRGYLNLRISKFMGRRFILSESGRRYAEEQGYIVSLRERKGLI